MSAKISPRRKAVYEIADFIGRNDLTRPYGGDVNSHGKYYSVTFCKPANLDGEVRIYGPRFIYVGYQSRYQHITSRDHLVFTSVQHALDFLRYAFVEFDGEQASAVPTKEGT